VSRPNPSLASRRRISSGAPGSGNDSTTRQTWYLHLSLALRILGCVSLVVVGLILCWPESCRQVIPSLSAEWAAVSLGLSGLMFVRAGAELRDVAVGPDTHKSRSWCGTLSYLVLALLLASPVAVPLLVHGVRTVLPS
jgi:hypothetical protein